MKQFYVYLSNNKIAIVNGDKIEVEDDFFRVGDNIFMKDRVFKIVENTSYQKDYKIIGDFN